MRVLLLGASTYKSIDLPSRIDGSYFLTNPFNGEKIIAIEANYDSWIIHNFEGIQVLKDDIPTENITLNIGDYYDVKGENLNLTLFCDSKNDQTMSLYKLPESISLKIGYSQDADIQYNFPKATNVNFELSFATNNWTINTNNALIYNNDSLLDTNQTYNLTNGDILCFYGLKLILMNGLLFVNNLNDLVKINNATMKKVSIKETEIPYMEVDEVDFYKDDDYYYNTPRIRRFIETYDLSIANPPTAPVEKEMPFLLVMGPMLTSGITSLVSLSSAITSILNKTATAASIIPQFITFGVTMITTFLWPSLTKKWQKSQNEKKKQINKEKYLAYLEIKRKEIIQETINQTTILNENLLPLSEYYNTIINKRRTIWERKISQRDFLTVRVGIGDQPLDVNIQFNDEEFKIEQDPLKEVAVQMVNDAKVLHNVPIGYSFYKKYATAIMGKEDICRPFIDNIMLQLIASHSYDELKIVIFTDEQNKTKWEKYKELPHLFSNSKDLRFFAYDPDSYKTISSFLENEFIQRANAQQEATISKEGEEGAQQPEVTYPTYYLIFTDNYALIRNLGICNLIISSQVNLGFGFAIYENKLARLPDKCTDFLMMDKPVSQILKTELDNYNQQQFNVEITDEYNMQKCADVLSNIPILFTQDLRSLPTSLSFLEMYGAGKLEHLNVLNRWKMNDPTQSLRAQIGINDEGDPIYLDLHEKFHGPHGLMAGTTGSGKSEFIITYILSMCVNYSPNEVAFILIDYKGGGLAGAFENKTNHIRLPHLAGTITNLDKNSLNRTLVSIQSELTRRQAVFNEVRDKLEASTIDIYKYQKYFREGKIDKPMPHLFIVCDEFAELKAQQPDFMDNLISAARIGRSLGVHLILATQKPSGVVNDQIWSNTKFRVCLKVAEPGDSQEIIKCPDAAEIKNAGRFYLQVGQNEIFVLGQSGWCGAPYVASDQIKKNYDRSLSFIDDIGGVIKNISDEDGAKKVVGDGDQLTNILKHIIKLAEKDNVHADNLWLDAIPGEIFHDDLIKKYVYTSDSPVAVLGEYDNPAGQTQSLFTLNLDTECNSVVFGQSMLGREMFLRMLLFSSVTRYSPEVINFYIFDFGSETFKIFSKLPHVGEVVLASEKEKIEKLFVMIQVEMAKRKKLLVDYNGDYNNYCKNADKSLPLIMVVINNYETFLESFPNYDELMLVLTREGPRYGITYMLITSSNAGLYSRFIKNFSHEFVLDMNSKEEYSNILGKVGNIYPADFVGRGLFKREEESYEFQIAKYCPEDKIVDTVKSLAANLEKTTSFRAANVPVLPEVVRIDDLKIEKYNLKSLPIGIEKERLVPYNYNFLSDKATAILANDVLSLKNFLPGLLTLFKNAGNVVTIYLDFDQLFEEIKPFVGTYCNDKIEDFVPKLLDFAKTKIINTNYYLFIFITGCDQFIEKIDSKVVDEIMELTKNNNVRVIYADSMYKVKNLMFESCFTEYVVSTNGIWVGNGMADQSVLKTNSYEQNQAVKISDDFAWMFKSGNVTLVKLVDVRTGEQSNEK